MESPDVGGPIAEYSQRGVVGAPDLSGERSPGGHWDSGADNGKGGQQSDLRVAEVHGAADSAD